MKATKRKRLEKAGWRVGSAEDFLKLTPEESALVNMRLSLAEKLRDRRLQAGLSQSQLARRLGSSQSRVAKMEAGDATVSLDLLVRAMLATGAKPSDVGHAIAGGSVDMVAEAGADFGCARSGDPRSVRGKLQDFGRAKPR